MIIGIRKKLIFISIAVLFLALGATTTVSSFFFMREYSAALKSRAFLVGSILKYQLEKLLKYDIPLNQLVGFDEQCQEIVTNYGDISYAMVLDLSGKILFHNDPQKRGEMFIYKNIQEILKDQKEEPRQYKKNGESFYNFSVPVQGLDNAPIAAVIIGFPASLITHKTALMVAYSVGAAIIFLTLGGISMVILLRYWVTTPLGQLLRAIMDIRSGGTDSAQLPIIKSKDEFGHLGRAFNEMVLQLRQSQAQVQNYTQELEFKVAESTSHLQEANEKLRQDIEVRLQAEKALRQTTQKLQTVINAAPLAIYVLDLQGRLQMWNPAAERIFGWRQEEVMGQRLPIVSEDKREEFRGLFQRALEGQLLAGIELTRRKKDGSSLEISLYTAPLYDDQGQVAGIMSLAADVTERRRAEEEIRKAHEALENVFASSVDAIGTVDRQGHITQWNKAAEEMFGYPVEEFRGKRSFDLYADPSELQVMLTQLRRRGYLRNYEISMRKKDGRVFPGSLSIRLLRDLDNRTTGSITVARDLSEFKMLEVERQRFSKMEAVGTLAGGIAHDFNNILTAIIGNLSLAMLDLQINEPARERLAEAEQACQQAQNLSQQLLTFAKGGAPIKKIVSLREIAAESASFACRGSQVLYQPSLPDDLWAAEADPGQISQVLHNLVINAIQAMPGGGMVRVRGENLVAEPGNELGLDAGRYVKIAIQDEGVGISADHLAKIFDPYFTTKQTGSGLGLATAYSIIKNHRGHISVESKLEQGSTFNIYLPASDRKVTQQLQEDGELIAGKGKILLMDDEPMVRTVLGKMLLTIGYEVEAAEDGAKALELYTRALDTGDPFVSVILDLTVPGGMGGKEVMERLLKIDPQIKAIVSSGYSDDPVMANFQSYGFTDVIAKPYRISELYKVLKKALAGWK
jgi:two-component system, cell cycle sensor histidine kinase and response regulator CckA